MVNQDAIKKKKNCSRMYIDRYIMVFKVYKPWEPIIGQTLHYTNTKL